MTAYTYQKRHIPVHIKGGHGDLASDFVQRKYNFTPSQATHRGYEVHIVNTRLVTLQQLSAVDNGRYIGISWLALLLR